MLKLCNVNWRYGLRNFYLLMDKIDETKSRKILPS